MNARSWGMIGGFWPVLNRIVTACVWNSVQIYWGSQAIRIVLGAIIGPKFASMRNNLPLSANIDTCSLANFFIFLAVSSPADSAREAPNTSEGKLSLMVSSLTETHWIRLLSS